MPWINITVTSVQPKLTKNELSALRTVQLNDGEGDPLPEIIEHVCNEIRGWVAGCQRNKLGAGITIPDKLESAALAMIRFRLATRLPVSSLLTEARKEEYRDALRLMERVAACQFAVEEPTELTDEKISGPVSPMISQSNRTFGRRQQDGI